VAEDKLRAYVNKGRETSQRVVATLMDESNRRVDILTPIQSETAMFLTRPDHLELMVIGNNKPAVLGDRSLRFSDWSENQLLTSMGIPQKFMSGLQTDGGVGQYMADMLLNGLLYRIGNDKDNRRLLRIVDDTIKGWLSPNYAIIDQGELLTGFALAIKQHADKGVLFTDGIVTDRRYAVTAIWPKVFEPWPGEAVVFGTELQSSDYGFGAVDLKMKLIRLVCINGAIGVSYFRRRHIGAKGGYGGDSLESGDAGFQISDRTRALSGAATVSLLTDALTGAFKPDSAEKVLSTYRKAANREIDPEKEAMSLRLRGVINAKEAETMPTLLAADMVELPDTTKKNSALRFGQLLSMMANGVQGERVLVMQESAGTYYLPQEA
jgi:hypothetical protein